ncbi:MAG: Acetoacetate metabolism regulatory protein AtoC [Acidobacteriales bacterium]|nr:Acetoacetate metabolism regulatory protein AtoC [Terriglobales bacterium]
MRHYQNRDLALLAAVPSDDLLFRSFVFIYVDEVVIYALLIEQFPDTSRVAAPIGSINCYVCHVAPPEVNGIGREQSVFGGQKTFGSRLKYFYPVSPKCAIILALPGEHLLIAGKAVAPTREGHSPVASRNSLFDLIGSSEPMQRLYDAILRVADSNTTVMIRGESGTGKELVARAIVAAGPRASKPFIGLNCAALPEALIESELFGHEKGAFTGAVVSRPGHIEMAHGGTLFLDEIATLPLALQTKLLRVLEDRAVQRLGGSGTKKIDFRLLTATNENLEDMVRTGRFREDLYYRIHVVPISVPPLRERTGDIAVLADHFIRVYCAANNVPTKRLDLETLEVLEEGNWQGNIRELENLIQRMVLMVEDKTICAYHLPEQILYTSARRHESLLIPPDGIDFDKEMERIEAAYLRAALLRAGGKKTGAAALLRINDQRMKYLARKYKIDKENS